MPRRNRRKHYPNEGRLGFNPNKYISGSGYHASNGQPRYAVRTESAPKPASDRHKARSCTKKKRRAMEEVYRIQESAGKVILPRNPKTTEQQSAVDLMKPTEWEENKITIFGGIRNWLKKTLSV